MRGESADSVTRALPPDSATALATKSVVAASALVGLTESTTLLLGTSTYQPFTPAGAARPASASIAFFTPVNSARLCSAVLISTSTPRSPPALAVLAVPVVWTTSRPLAASNQEPA